MVSNSVVSGQVTVEVRDSQDRPIANAQVALIWSGKVQATGKTDATGQTESIHVTLPANPLFYNMPTVDFPPVGTLTVVVWKNGYVPQVDFEGTVFAYGSSQVVDVTLPQAKAPAEDAVGMTGSGVNPDSSPATRAAWADGVHWLLSSASAMDGVIAAGTPLSLSVVDLQGRPVAGAQVVWLVNGVIEGRTVTGTDGQAVCRASGFPDWRTVDGSQVLGLMVSKDGYAPAVTLEVRVPPTGLQPWTVHLSPLAGATGVPTQAVPAAVVTESQAEQLYHLALDTNQGG
ncbi:hypothetical protein GCM10025857_09420 [Alicyclobacillus contaminans]|nr:hypothetical protein GCM10025857_09420 [Alicyclobacillus contaminans]